MLDNSAPPPSNLLSSCLLVCVSVFTRTPCPLSRLTYRLFYGRITQSGPGCISLAPRQAKLWSIFPLLIWRPSQAEIEQCKTRFMTLNLIKRNQEYLKVCVIRQQKSNQAVNVSGQHACGTILPLVLCRISVPLQIMLNVHLKKCLVSIEENKSK